MLYFTRWKALGIILIALVVCLCAVPNFFPEARVKTWPAWAQRRLVLGLDLQGGSYLLLEVDSNYVKKEKLDQVRDDVRRTLRETKIGYTGLATKGDSVEVRITKDTDQATALSKLRELSQPLGGLLGSNGQRSLDVGDAGGGVIRLTVPQAAVTERIRQAIEQSIQIVERRVNELGTVEPLIQRQGTGAGAGSAGSHSSEGIARQDRENGFPDGRQHRLAGAGGGGPVAAGFGNPA
jgi:preprotein translocase subunit SecD